MESVVASNTEALRIETTAEDGTVYSCSASVSTASSVLRKIDFRPARKQFNGLSGSGKNGEFWIETLNPDPGRKRLLSQQPGMEAGKKKVESGSDFVENGLDPELAFRINFKRIGAGLENVGNTCFLNSVLQCLTYTEPLAAYLQNSKHQNSCHIAGFCALCAIQKHVSRALQSTGRSLVPKDLVSNLRCISRNFRNARQEDAHEYMVNLLESMHKCCLPLGTPCESPAAYEKSLVHKIFGGRLRSRVECQQCHRPSDKFDPFLDLSLDIVKASSLPVALQNFTAPEMLDGGEKQYQCQRCRQKVRAKKQLTVHKAPYVLTIHLKRFHAHDPGRKIDKNVVFGPSLDMKPFISDNSYEGKLEYSLYGVLVHFGHNTHSGHYVCFVRTSSGMWYFLNDNEVRQVSEKTVLAQKAYMLFYVRDRRVVAPKRPCDTSISKENVKAAVSSNIANSVFKQLSKEHADNALGENRVGSSAMKQKDELSVGTSKDGLSPGTSMGTLLKKMPREQNDVGPKGSVPMADPVLGPSLTMTLLDDHSKASSSPNDVKTIPIQQNDVVPKALVPKVDPALEPSVTVPLPDDHSKTSSSPNSNPMESLPQPVPSVSVNSNVDTPKCENATIPIGILTSSCNGPHNAAMHKPGMNETSQQINLVSNTRGLTDVSSGVTDEEKLDIVQRVTFRVDSGDSGKKLDEIDPANSPDKLSSETNQGRAMPNEGAAACSLSDKDVDGSHGIGQELNKSSISSAMQVHRKSKKKLLKRQAPMLITPRSHFFRTLALMGKKKHKKNKCRAKDAHNLVKEQLLDPINQLSSELGPSTSEKSMTTLDSRKSRKKGAKSSSRKGETAGKCNNNPAMDMIFGELRERSNQNGAMLETEELLENSSTSITEANQQNARQPDSTQNIKEDPFQNGKLNMLCQRTVSRWDGGVSQVDSNIETEPTSIGHVGDEWDEEYDRGKRKKLRHSSSKHKFGGPNLFQEIATNKTRSKPQSKKSKKHRARFGNQPFRI